MADDGDCDVGYGKPPFSGRFRKGTSGNPKGRPKKTRNFRTDLRDVLNAKVAVTENGRKRRVTSQQAMLMRLREKALKGDARAMEKLIDLAREHAIEDMARKDERKLAASEEDILARYSQALLKTQAGAAHEKSDAGDGQDET